MKRYLLLSLIAVFLSFHSFGQTTRQKIETAIKDPRAAENAAKADSLLINKKNITDTTLQPATATPVKKEKRCLFHRKKKTASPDKV